MAKKNGTIVYKCSSCGALQPRWLGRCPACGEWNTLEENIIDALGNPNQKKMLATKAKLQNLSDVDEERASRLSTGSKEFDRVLGGGAAKSSAILIGGEPGIGKSTLLLQTASRVAESGGAVLYVSGEESAAQIKSRSSRLHSNEKNISLLCTMRLEDILDALEKNENALVIVDSIQTVYSAEAGLIPSTINQLKYCANELISWVKERDAVLMMSAHVTKEGIIAGPKSLEHMVDTVISFERTTDEHRFLRAAKNRFGSVDEIGIFEMDENGLIEVADQASLFIVRRDGNEVAGTACTAVFEGSRVFVVEIQALTVPAKASISRVYSDKIDAARVARVAAVLEKKTGLRFSDNDLYINVAGGIRLTESAIDAALAAALYSARTDIPVHAKTAIIGELSLAGEMRQVSRLDVRAKTARALGFETIISVNEARTIKDLVKMIFAN